MTVQLKIGFEQLVNLVKQLSVEQQQALIDSLLSEAGQPRPLSINEKIKLLDAVKLRHSIREEPSVRREDWYGDDGR